MDETRAQRIEDKLDKIADTLTDHAVTHARNTTSLEDHIRRTELLEEALKPLKQTDTILRACLKGLAALATLLTILYTITRLLKGI